MQTKYWIIVASKDHAERGIKAGAVQANHGKAAPLKRMKANDWVLIYSSKKHYDKDDKLQKFVAIGQVKDEQVYQFEMGANFKPYRRNMVWHDCEEVSILPLIGQLEFIENKKQWGYPFRYGFFEIDEKDFNTINSHMLKYESANKQ